MCIPILQHTHLDMLFRVQQLAHGVRTRHGNALIIDPRSSFHGGPQTGYWPQSLVGLRPGAIRAEVRQRKRGRLVRDSFRWATPERGDERSLR